MRIAYSVPIDGTKISLGPFPMFARSITIVNQTAANAFAQEDGGALYEASASTSATWGIGNTVRLLCFVDKAQKVGQTVTVVVSDEDAAPSVQQLATLASASGASGVIEGRIDAAGNVIAGSGFTVVKGVAGVYTVTFTTPFAGVPVITVGPLDVGVVWSSPRWNVVPTANGFSILFTTTGNVGTDSPWAFTAQVP